MEALSVSKVPTGPEWQYEPKWDGFRCLAFRDGLEVELQSKSSQSLTRYFPELVSALLELKAKRFVLDGEVVVPEGGELNFDQLLQRIHPAASRVKKLSAEHPAQLIVFDLLMDARGRSLIDRPLADRRARLENFSDRFLKGQPDVRLSPATRDIREARKLLAGAGGSLDGIIAKRLDQPYRSGERDGMQKIKPQRTADCVVGGFRYAGKGKEVGSLLLGLYDQNGLLHHVGFCSGLKSADRPVLTRKLEKLIHPPGFTGKAPGGPSRWNRGGRSEEWKPLRPELVVEVGYDHVTGRRFRHGTRLIRWRPDKAPGQCRLDQLEQKKAPSLAALT